MRSCNRYILIRNAQQLKNLLQQQGDMSDHNLPSMLTPKGQEMSNALCNGLESYINRPMCDPDAQKPVIRRVLYENDVCKETLQPFLNKMSLESSQLNITDFLDRNTSDKNTSDKNTSDRIEIILVCCTGPTLRNILRLLNIPLTCGPPLGGVSVFDILPSVSEPMKDVHTANESQSMGDVFVHAVNDLGPLALGGYPIDEVFYWNNTQ